MEPLLQLARLMWCATLPSERFIAERKSVAGDLDIDCPTRMQTNLSVQARRTRLAEFVERSGE